MEYLPTFKSMPNVGKKSNDHGAFGLWSHPNLLKNLDQLGPASNHLIDSSSINHGTEQNLIFPPLWARGKRVPPKLNGKAPWFFLILSQFTKKIGIANLCMACVGDALADAIVILIRMEPGRNVHERMNDSTRPSRVFRGLVVGFENPQKSFDGI